MLRPVAFGGPPAFSVTVHDVAPATQARCEQLIAAIGRVNALPFTLLVVPSYHRQASTPVFQRWIEQRLRAGDELVLHGLTHLDEAAAASGVLERARRRWYTAGEGEFAALDAGAAAERLDAGRDWFARRGWPLRGFVAPAWLLGAGAWRALATQPFDYTCTLRHLVRLEPRGTGELPVFEAWSIVYSTRAAWRRALSLAWNGALAWRQRGAAWMRFELHPSDVEFPRILDAALRGIWRAAAEARDPLTLGGIADQLAEAAAR